MYQLLTDLKQQRKESGKTKQSSGQQNLNTIMYEVSSKPAQAGVIHGFRYLDLCIINVESNFPYYKPQ